LIGQEGLKLLKKHGRERPKKASERKKRNKEAVRETRLKDSKRSSLCERGKNEGGAKYSSAR